MDGYEASRRRMLGSLSNGRRLLLHDDHDGSLVDELHREGLLQQVGVTRTGTEYTISDKGLAYLGTVALGIETVLVVAPQDQRL